jgi:hypothetical protein
MNIIMFRELAREELLVKLDLEIKRPSQEETGEGIGNRTSNQAVALTVENQICVEATDTTTTAREDKEAAPKLAIMLRKTSRRWEQLTT